MSPSETISSISIPLRYNLEAVMKPCGILEIQYFNSTKVQFRACKYGRKVGLCGISIPLRYNLEVSQNVFHLVHLLISIPLRYNLEV